jgi:subtilisin family serine protease
VDGTVPGFNIYSTIPQNGYSYKTSTFFAATHVSGLAALLFSVFSDRNGDGRLNDEVRAAIEAGHKIEGEPVTAPPPGHQ